jgi:ferredoxin
MEETILEFAERIRPESRPSCQVKFDANVDGLVVDIPPA